MGYIWFFVLTCVRYVAVAGLQHRDRSGADFTLHFLSVYVSGTNLGIIDSSRAVNHNHRFGVEHTEPSTNCQLPSSIRSQHTCDPLPAANQSTLYIPLPQAPFSRTRWCSRSQPSIGKQGNGLVGRRWVWPKVAHGFAFAGNLKVHTAAGSDP